MEKTPGMKPAVSPDAVHSPGVSADASWSELISAPRVGPEPSTGASGPGAGGKAPADTGLAGAAGVPYATGMPIRVTLKFVGGGDTRVQLGKITTLHRGRSERPEHVEEIGTGSRWSSGLQAFCLLLVEVAQGQECIVGEDARLLRSALRESGKQAPRVKWPGPTESILGYRRAVRDLLNPDPQGGPVRLDQQELNPSDIVIYWNGRLLTQTTEPESVKQLAQLAAALSRNPSRPGGGAHGDGVHAELERRLAALFGGPGWAPRFFVAPAEAVTGMSIPAARAAGFLTEELMRLVRRKGSVTCAVSGGTAQLAMAKEIERGEVLWAQEGGPQIGFLALNRMAWPDLRIEQSAEGVALRLARAVGTGRVALVPPTPLCAKLERGYAMQLDEVDLFLVSGGAAQGSFVSQFLGMCEVPTPSGTVGDLAGHLLDARGGAVEDERVARALEGFRCHPSPAELRRLAADPRRTVALLLGEWSHRLPLEMAGAGAQASSETSKAPLARACLAARLVNTVILPEPLARELLQSRPRIGA